METSDNYSEIVRRSEGQYKEKGSKFIAIAFPVHSEEEVKLQLELIRKEYYDARHHCFAYIIGSDKSISKSNDDGEPSGTAGKPILNQILSKELTNICVVVVRYFGGVKLGVSGLILAYKTAVKEALDAAIISQHTVNEIYKLSFQYPMMNEVMRLIKVENLETRNHEFENSCSLEVIIRKNDAKRISGRFIDLYGVGVKYIETC
ncbi:MAG: YigZ family protein [Bacteroidales bacterium]|nr:YigZ family protein [Bacteroidales bacterium]